ncbi:hypothetical protein [Rhodococcus sp. NPDC049939]|uniref:hypothetical protein n=1 Tax=Rhodococcus sp. NPDC049939 TaxID=3155511 RepID=UPI0033C8EB76
MTESAGGGEDSSLLLRRLGHQLASNGAELAGTGSIEYIHHTATYQVTGSILVGSKPVPAFKDTDFCDVHSWRSPDGTRKVIQTRNGRLQSTNGVRHPDSGPPQVEFDRENPLRAIDTESALSVIASTGSLWKYRIIPPWLTGAILIDLSQRPQVSAEVLTQNGHNMLTISAEGISFDAPTKNILVLDTDTAMASMEYVFRGNSDAPQDDWEVVAEVNWLGFSRVESFEDPPVPD